MVEVPHLVSTQMAVRASYLVSIMPDGPRVSKTLLCDEEASLAASIFHNFSSKSCGFRKSENRLGLMIQLRYFINGRSLAPRESHLSIANVSRCSRSNLKSQSLPGANE